MTLTWVSSYYDLSAIPKVRERLLTLEERQTKQLLRSGKADKGTYNAGWKVAELSRLYQESRRIAGLSYAR